MSDIKNLCIVSPLICDAALFVGAIFFPTTLPCFSNSEINRLARYVLPVPAIPVIKQPLFDVITSFTISINSRFSLGTMLYLNS